MHSNCKVLLCLNLNNMAVNYEATKFSLCLSVFLSFLFFLTDVKIKLF